MPTLAARPAFFVACVLTVLSSTWLPDRAIAQKSDKRQGNRMADSVAFYFPGYDKNGDGELDAAEWGRRGNFDLLDTDKNGAISRQEFSALYASFGRGWPTSAPVATEASPTLDTSLQTDMVDLQTLGQPTVCIVSRLCDGGDTLAEQAGLMETGLGPVFPEGVVCLGIDETFAEPYTDKTGKGRHGGIDMPVDFGTPIIAAAAGTVVGKIDNEMQLRGKTVVLRHSPQDTGLPFWTYTEYAHLSALPTQALGQRVRMGEFLGPTGNTGVKKTAPSLDTARRPGVHFAVYTATSPHFANGKNYVIPEGVQWMDPNAFYRNTGPYTSQALASLPDVHKWTAIPVMLGDGATLPRTTKRIWPYACKAATALN